MYVVRPETGEGPQRPLHCDLLLPCGFLPMTPVEGETNTTKTARQPRTRQHLKGNSLDEANENESQSDPEEYHYDGYRNLRVESLGFNHTSNTMEHLPETIEPQPLKMLTTVEQDPSDVAEALPDDAQVKTCDLDLLDPGETNLPDPGETNLPDPGETNLPDPGDTDLPNPEESRLPAGQKPEHLLGEDLKSVHPPAQTTLDSNENVLTKLKLREDALEDLLETGRLLNN